METYTGIMETDKGYVLNTTCIDCGTVFGMTEEEIIWYRNHGLVLPKRCPDCRKVNRKERLAEVKKQKSENSSSASIIVDPSGISMVKISTPDFKIITQEGIN